MSWLIPERGTQTGTSLLRLAEMKTTKIEGGHKINPALGVYSKQKSSHNHILTLNQVSVIHGNIFFTTKNKKSRNPDSYNDKPF